MIWTLFAVCSEEKQDRQCECKHNIEARLSIHSFRGKVIIILNICSECVFVALGIQQESACASCCHLCPVRLVHNFPQPFDA